MPPHKVVDRIKIIQSISNLLESIHPPFNIHAGDFNMITNLGEKKGGIRKLDRDLEAFLSTIESLSLVDIPTI